MALATATPAFAQNLVGNGSFESGFSGWTLSATPATDPYPPVVITYGNTNTYPTGAFGEAILADNVASRSPDAVGTHVAYFSSDVAVDTITTTAPIVLVGGTTYNLGFDYYVPLNGFNNPNDATLKLLLGTSTVASLQGGSPGSGITPQTWYNFNATFTPTATTTSTLSFQFQGLGVTAADFAIDRVYVVAATSVPEPATWGMMILGFGVVGGLARRRRASGDLAIA